MMQRIRGLKVYEVAYSMYVTLLHQSRDSVAQKLFFGDKNSRNRVMIIAPGELEIPVMGWGAVETLINRKAQLLASRGWFVAVVNSWKPGDWVEVIRKCRPTVIVNHHDVFSFAARIASKVSRAKLVSLSHLAYAGAPENWSRLVRRRFHHASRADVTVCLSPRIAATWDAEFNCSTIEVISNYTEVDSFSFNESPLSGIRFVVLGKVERRKRQFDLASKLDPRIPIDFLGAIADDRVGLLDENLRNKFRGPVTRQWLFQNLGSYTHIVLCSEAEADALVLYEGQAAGLEVVTCPEALGSTDSSLAWVHVETFERLPNLISKLYEDGSLFRRETIREHALANYSEDAWISHWESVLS